MTGASLWRFQRAAGSHDVRLEGLLATREERRGLGSVRTMGDDSKIQCMAAEEGRFGVCQWLEKRREVGISSNAREDGGMARNAEGSTGVLRSVRSGKQIHEGRAG
jgi:hypothetical protein